MSKETQRNRTPISRRTVLRGAGVTMALPWLESFQALANTAEGAHPKRFAVLFMGNGVNHQHWLAEGSGADMKLGGTLSILEPIKSKVNVINGLFNKPATGQGIHPAMTGAMLTGAKILKGPVVRSGISVDQVIAKHYGQDTALSNMTLACEQPMTGYHETNFSNAYSSHLSWESADSPVPNEVYPSLAFDNLFENRGSLRNMSILDRVKDRAEALTKKVSSTDKAKLDEYLTSVRAVEKRVEQMRKVKEVSDDKAKATNKHPFMTMERPANGLPEDLREHARLMCDIIAIAFQTDKTRVATVLLARDLGALYYPFLNVREGHHAASHNDTSEGYERISRFHLSQLLYLAQKLEAMPEGNGTVLDNSLLLWVNNMWSGTRHDNLKLPVVTAGGLGGTLKTGRTLDYLKAGDENRKLCSLYLDIMDRFDIKLDKFGDASTRLQNL
jgi:hypothetical protein